MAAQRDTRGLALTEAERFNYYPATPLPLLSWIFEGSLRMVHDPASATAAAPVLGAPLQRVLLSGPQRRPSASWSHGPVHALSVGFHPEALSRLLGIAIDAWVDRTVPLEQVVDGPLLQLFLDVLHDDGRSPMQRVEALLAPLWQGTPRHIEGQTLRRWLRSLALRAALSPAGAGLRQVQRRIKRWAGQSHRELQLYARAEAVLARTAARPEATPLNLAALAAEAGFADQSHMGREIRRVTGTAPGRLDELIRRDEAFWFYRLMQEHLRDT